MIQGTQLGLRLWNTTAHYRSPTDDPREEIHALRARVATLERENRLLRVSYGSTFEELEAAGKVGGGRVYGFEELLSLSPEFD